MERDSFIFYKSFFESGMDLKDTDRLKFFDRILNYAINGENKKTTGIAETMFKLVKPNIDSNNKKYEDGCKGGAFGHLGGRPRKNPTGVSTNNPTAVSKKTPNVDVDVNEDDNDTEDENLNDIFSRNLDPQQQKIINSQKRQQVNTRGKSWIGIRNKVTGRNDVMDSESFRNLQNFISDMTNEEFEARCTLFKKAIDLINKKNLGKYLESFGKNNIQDFTITDFIKKINLFGGSIDQVFKNITQKDNQSKVIRMIHEEDIRKIGPIQAPIQKIMNEEERKLAREQLQRSRDKMFKKIL